MSRPRRGRHATDAEKTSRRPVAARVNQAAQAAPEGAARTSDAGTGTRRSSSARTRRGRSTSAATACIEATIAATRGRPISPDLTRNLDPAKLPIMGKVWPPDSVAFNQATTRLSTITALDESPLVEGLIYAGTDDGLLQVTEDGGKHWRKVDPPQGLPEYSYVTDVQPSARDADTVFATFNNWQRGDYKPYVMRSTDRGRTWTSITGDLPARSGAWSIVQDPGDAKLLFVGLEFGVYVTVDGGDHWVQLKGGIPTIQARDLAIHRREGDLVVGTFGRGAYILDDYTALREVTPEALAERARLFPLRDAYLYNELGQVEAAWGDVATPNPPYGALFTYSVGQPVPTGSKLALTISDESGKQVRRTGDSRPTRDSIALPGICAVKRRRQHKGNAAVIKPARLAVEDAPGDRQRRPGAIAPRSARSRETRSPRLATRSRSSSFR